MYRHLESCGVAALAFGMLLALSTSSTQITTVLSEQKAQKTSPPEWLKFDSDACGHLGRVQGAHSAPNKYDAADEDGDEAEDEPPSGNAWIMSDEATELEQDWAEEHPQVAIVADAVQNFCADDPAEASDDDAIVSDLV